MDALVTLTGNVGTPVERRELPTCLFARFRLAHTPRVNRQGGWSDGETTWLDVNCYRALAEHVAGSLRPGEPVIVSGRLRTERWVGRTDGEQHERVVLEAVTVGHDLNRGTTEFRRTERVGIARHAPDDGAHESEEADGDAERLAAVG